MQQSAREAALQRWSVEEAASLQGLAGEQIRDSKWQKVAGDASFRRYFRLQLPSFRLHLPSASYIAMDAPPQQEDIAKFLRVAALMEAQDLRVPAIYAQQLDLGFLLLEDFGDHMVRDDLAADRGQHLFSWILPTLGRMASCAADELPRFDAVAMRVELDLFIDWYLGEHCRIVPNANQLQRWRALCDELIDTALEQPQHFVHRDFHSCNLHRIDSGAPGIIDFQDAVLGPASYDLASWLWDRYISWPRDSLENWMEQARPVLAPLLEVAHWRKCCDLVGLQRNLKIIGIFARLNYRDGKSEYLELLPRFAGYVEDVLSRYGTFKDIQNDMSAWLAPCLKP